VGRCRIYGDICKCLNIEESGYLSGDRIRISSFREFNVTIYSKTTNPYGIICFETDKKFFSFLSRPYKNTFFKGDDISSDLRKDMNDWINNNLYEIGRCFGALLFLEIPKPFVSK